MFIAISKLETTLHIQEEQANQKYVQLEQDMNELKKENAVLRGYMNEIRETLVSLRKDSGDKRELARVDRSKSTETDNNSSRDNKVTVSKTSRLLRGSGRTNTATIRRPNFPVQVSSKSSKNSKEQTENVASGANARQRLQSESRKR